MCVCVLWEVMMVVMYCSFVAFTRGLEDKGLRPAHPGVLAVAKTRNTVQALVLDIQKKVYMYVVCVCVC